MSAVAAFSSAVAPDLICATSVNAFSANSTIDSAAEMPSQIMPTMLMMRAAASTAAPMPAKIVVRIPTAVRIMPILFMIEPSMLNALLKPDSTDISVENFVFICRYGLVA
jgi:hypothetical protein